MLSSQFLIHFQHSSKLKNISSSSPNLSADNNPTNYTLNALQQQQQQRQQSQSQYRQCNEVTTQH